MGPTLAAWNVPMLRLVPLGSFLAAELTGHKQMKPEEAFLPLRRKKGREDLGAWATKSIWECNLPQKGSERQIQSSTNRFL